jgi:hypothetical protein
METRTMNDELAKLIGDFDAQQARKAAPAPRFASFRVSDSAHGRRTSGVRWGLVAKVAVAAALLSAFGAAALAVVI